MARSAWLTTFSTVLLALSSARSLRVPRQERNDGIHLAVSPKCASSLKGTVADVNAGVVLDKSIKTFVAFGDSYTDGGIRDGSPLLPAVLTPPSPKAGGRTTNGPVWAEGLTSDVNATIMDYAVGGAVTDVKLWPSKANASDFVHQVQLFTSQKHTLDPKTTIYSAFFGINDFSASSTDGNHLPQAAQAILNQLNILISPPTNAKNILVLDDYGRGTSTAAGNAFKQSVFDGLASLRSNKGVNVAYVDFSTLWNGVLHGSPGFEAFGYTSSGFCTVSSTTTVGACSDPDHTFYWISGHPSKETHRIMADYVEKVLSGCSVS